MAPTPLVLTSCTAFHGVTGPRRLYNRCAGRALPHPSSCSGVPHVGGRPVLRYYGYCSTSVLRYYRPRCLEARAHRRAVLLATGETGGLAVCLSGYEKKFSSTNKPCLLWRVQIFSVSREDLWPLRQPPAQAPRGRTSHELFTGSGTATPRTPSRVQGPVRRIEEGAAPCALPRGPAVRLALPLHERPPGMAIHPTDERSPCRGLPTPEASGPSTPSRTRWNRACRWTDCLRPRKATPWHRSRRSPKGPAAECSIGSGLADVPWDTFVAALVGRTRR